MGKPVKTGGRTRGRPSRVGMGKQDLPDLGHEIRGSTGLSILFSATMPDVMK